MRRVGDVMKRLISGVFLMVIFGVIATITCLLTLGIAVPLTLAQSLVIGGGAVAGLAIGALAPAVSGVVFEFFMRLFEG